MGERETRGRAQKFLKFVNVDCKRPSQIANQYSEVSVRYALYRVRIGFPFCVLFCIRLKFSPVLLKSENISNF